jgi:LysR family transcriptional regulator, regulator for genes of the gallate degradation pathway
VPLTTEISEATGSAQSVSTSAPPEPERPRKQLFRIEPNLRRLRAFIAISDCGSVLRAAEKLHLTQSSLTRAVRALERQLGLMLFERTRRGMVLTEFGAIVSKRARRAMLQLDIVEKELTAAHAKAGTVRYPNGFSNKVTHRQLSAFLGIASCGTETGAAQQLALSQPAMTQALRDLERLVGASLFVRTARGMVATPIGETLLRRAKLAFGEIAAAGNDIVTRVGSIMGRVVVGVQPYAGAPLMARAVNLLLKEHPSLKVVMVEGTYRSLIQGLLCGDIDLIVGGLNHPVFSDVVRDQLFQDELSLVVRKGHVLVAKKDLSFTDLSGVEWVVPGEGTPARKCFDEIIKAAALEIGEHPVESDSTLTQRALLLESDRVALISRRVARLEEAAGLLAILPLKIEKGVVPVGIHMRADALPSIGVEALVRHLHAISASPGP